MSFPQTRHTLIRRLATDADERDWRQFMADYWPCVCRFAQRRAHLNIDDAEDVASQVFEALLTHQMLNRWAADGASKLRTLLCTVVRHVLGNRARVAQGRRRLLQDNAVELIARDDLPTIKALDAPEKQIDALAAAWIESLLQRAVESLVDDYHRTGKGDYFRVLYGRVCEGMTMPQISETLGIPITSAENYFKAAKKRLTAKLQELIRRHVERYCEPSQVDAEFTQEWDEAGAYLTEHGGLEQAIAQAYKGLDCADTPQRQARAMHVAVERITAALPQVPGRSEPGI